MVQCLYRKLANQPNEPPKEVDQSPQPKMPLLNRNKIHITLSKTRLNNLQSKISFYLTACGFLFFSITLRLAGLLRQPDSFSQAAPYGCMLASYTEFATSLKRSRLPACLSYTSPLFFARLSLLPCREDHRNIYSVPAKGCKDEKDPPQESPQSRFLLQSGKWP